MTACAWFDLCGMPEGHHNHVCGIEGSHRAHIDCHPFEAAPEPLLVNLTSTDKVAAPPLTAASEALLDEMFGTVTNPNGYFRPSEWCEEPSNVRLQLERIEAAAASRATEGLVAALEGVIDRIAIDALVAAHRGEP